MSKDKKVFAPTIENRKAYHDYFVEETLECGIELRGNEVKSIRSGKVSIKESWISVESNELLIKKMHVNAWETSNKFDVDESRERRLLAHKSEIRELDRKVQRGGYTIVPLKIYFSNGILKIRNWFPEVFAFFQTYFRILNIEYVITECRDLKEICFVFKNDLIDIADTE